MFGTRVNALATGKCLALSRSSLTLTASLSAMVAVCMGGAANAADMGEASDLLNLSLEELSNIEVTSVSKKKEKETEAAAAIYVITQDDIRRSGATAIPELLRMVPGITVTQAGSHDWTVASRGFNDQFSNKLLVLMDGRTIYSPLFSGVIWDMQDTMLEDIERIEVIRGPGATLWGANAVNGVINIITKDAKDTQGGMVTAIAGNQINGIGGARYGGKISQDSYLRAYAKYTNYDDQDVAAGGSAHDSWQKQQAGFRSDSKVSDSAHLTVQSDIYALDENSPYTFPDLNSGTFTSRADGRKGRGANILARWTEKQSSNSEISLQAYFDNAYLQTSFFNDETNTADIDFQHAWTGWQQQEVVWGLGYRYIHDTNDPASQQFALTPKTRSDNLFNLFVQDKFTLLPESVFLTLGSKFERNDYSGFEVQPSARMSWLIADNQTLWGSVARAVHTPSRFTDDGSLSLVIDPVTANPINILVANAGNRSLDSEELIAYELGYRIQPTKSLSFDAAAFYNDYDKIFTGVLNPADAAFNGVYILQPVYTRNTNSVQSMGFELSSKWNVSKEWQLAGAYSYIDLRFDNKSGGIGGFFVGKHPKHMFNMRSTYAFTNNLEMTNALYTMDELNAVNIPGYYRFDTVLSYPIMEGVEIRLVGQNLFDAYHKEFPAFFYGSAAEIRRSIYGNAVFRF